MTLLDKPLLPELYDCAINGVGYLVAWEIEKNLAFVHAAYLETGSDLVVEKTDFTTEEMTENKGDKMYWRSQRSWHKGAGQQRYDQPKVSDPDAFLLSQGVDVRVPGRASLYPDITNVYTSSNAYVAPAKLAAANNMVWVEDYTVAQSDRWVGLTLPATDGGAVTTTPVRAGITNGTLVVDVASDGQNLYFAAPDAGPAAIYTIAGNSSSGAVGTVYASGTFGTGAAATDARTIAWAKGQLVAAGIQSGLLGAPSTVWRLFAVGAGAGGTSKELLLLPPGYTVHHNAITSIAGFILFGATSAGQSVVYAWDGQTTPYVCAELPEGDTILCMENYLGVEVLIGCSRAKTTGEQTGVLYVGQATSAGQLILQEIVEIGDNGIPWPIGTVNDGKSYDMGCIRNRGRYSYFTWQPFGTGVYDHAYQSYSRHLGNLYANAGSLLNGGNSPVVFPPIGDLVVCQRRLCFSTVDTFGATYPIYAENVTKLVASGQILSSVIDWNIDKPKNILQAELGTLPLPAGTSSAVAYSTDGGTTSTTIGTLSTTGATLLSSSATATPPLNFSANSNTINSLVTLTSDAATHTQSPFLKKAGFGAWYGSKPTLEWQMYLRCDDRLTTKPGTPYVITGAGGGIVGPAPTLSDQIVALLRALRVSQAIVDFQPPGWGDTRTDTYKVQVRGYELFRWNVPGAGFGGAVRVELKEAP